jgi:hypothetical protein
MRKLRFRLRTLLVVVALAALVSVYVTERWRVYRWQLHQKKLWETEIDKLISQQQANGRNVQTQDRTVPK